LTRAAHRDFDPQGIRWLGPRAAAGEILRVDGERSAAANFNAACG
jgi:hypothetical protein